MTAHKFSQLLLFSLVITSLTDTALGQCEIQKLLPSYPRPSGAFGIAIASSHDTLVIGSNFGGGVTVFARSGPRWEEEAVLQPHDRYGWHFGTAVAISGDRIAVGAWGDGERGSNAGACYIFRRQGQTWTVEGKLLAVDADDGDRFGTSVAMEGDTIIVGAPDRQPGAAYVFGWDGLSWEERQQLAPTDCVRFGESVALEGPLAVIGASGNVGAVYSFVFDGSQWVEEAKLTADDGQDGDQLGISVSIDGSLVAAGAWYADGCPEYRCRSWGAVYLFRREAQPTSSVAGIDRSSWVQETKLMASDSVDVDLFGWSVDVSRDVVVVGAPSGEAPDYHSGAVYLFRKELSGLWTESAKLAPSDLAAEDGLGLPVVLGSDTIFSGARFGDHLAMDAGSAYVWPLASSTSYGTGWPGRLGVPDLSTIDIPTRGSTVGLAVENSLGFATVGILLIGHRSASIDTGFGGTLFVEPSIQIPLIVPRHGRILPLHVPHECAQSAATQPLFDNGNYLQVVQLDPGASHGVSFTRGLRIFPGY